MDVVGYVRVSTEEQARNGYGLDAQKDAIRAAVTARDWNLIDIVVDDGYVVHNALTASSGGDLTSVRDRDRRRR